MGLNIYLIFFLKSKYFLLDVSNSWEFFIMLFLSINDNGVNYSGFTISIDSVASLVISEDSTTSLTFSSLS